MIKSGHKLNIHALTMSSCMPPPNKENDVHLNLLKCVNNFLKPCVIHIILAKTQAMKV